MASSLPSPKIMAGMLFRERNPAQLIEMIVAHHGNKLTSAYSRWRNIRCEIRANEECRHPNFNATIANLLRSGDEISDEERSNLETLVDAKLPIQFKIVSQNKVIKQLFKRLPTEPKLLFEEYYDFNLPKEYFLAKRDLNEAAMQKQFTHSGKKSYSIELHKCLEIRERCINHLIDFSPPIKTKPQMRKLACAVQFLTGRRFSDIVFYTNFEPGANEYQALGSCFSKDQYLDKNVVIPLLTKFEYIKKAMDAIRAFNVDAKPSKFIWTSNANHAKKAVYGCKLDHTEIRNIYQDLAFSERRILNFVFPEIEYQLEWARRVFNHKSIKETCVYSVMNIN